LAGITAALEQYPAVVIGGEDAAGGDEAFGSGVRGSFQYSVRPMDPFRCRRGATVSSTFSPAPTPRIGLATSCTTWPRGRSVAWSPRGQEAGAVRNDVDATDIAVILRMLSFIIDLAPRTPRLTERYLSLVLAGLRPDDAPLPGSSPTDKELRAGIANRTEHHRPKAH
jgi:hypothetical protein